jgi:hypothetical protein
VFNLSSYRKNDNILDLAECPATKAGLGLTATDPTVKLREAFYWWFGGIGQDLAEVSCRTLHGHYTITYMPDGSYTFGRFDIKHHSAVSYPVKQS